MRTRRIALPNGVLWQESDFLLLWGAQSVSQVGSAVSKIALPLVAVLVLHATAFQFALLAASELGPYIILSLPAGVFVDRIPRRPVLVITDLGRGILLASIPLAASVGALSLTQLYIVALGVGVLTVFFDIAYQAYLPSVVPGEQLVEANSKLETTRSGAGIVGPGLGGLLVSVLSAPVTIALDAVSFLMSALLVSRICRPEPPLRRSESRRLAGVYAELVTGIAWVARSPYLRSIALYSGLTNLFANAVTVLFFIYAARSLGLGGAAIGLTYSCGGIGFLCGALLARPLIEKFGIGNAILLGSLLFGSGLILIPIASPRTALLMLIPSFVITGIGAMVLNVSHATLRQTLVPHHLQGRTNSVLRLFVVGAYPLGALLGGGIGGSIGVRNALWLVAACGAVTGILRVFSPLCRIVGIPPAPPAPGRRYEGVAELDAVASTPYSPAEAARDPS